jgi:hypothetical protein
VTIIINGTSIKHYHIENKTEKSRVIKYFIRHLHFRYTSDGDREFKLENS